MATQTQVLFVRGGFEKNMHYAMRHNDMLRSGFRGSENPLSSEQARKEIKDNLNIFDKLCPEIQGEIMAVALLPHLIRSEDIRMKFKEVVDKGRLDYMSFLEIVVMIARALVQDPDMIDDPDIQHWNKYAGAVAKRLTDKTYSSGKHSSSKSRSSRSSMW